ncbi:hypothetical protein JX266_014196 [Neoarthrinium moseri]|nr:hypothetical protein JX266_014196 [Neoarthrinium moseri]
MMRHNGLHIALSRNDHSDVDIGTPALGIVWTFVVLTGVIVGLRVWTQIRVTRLFGLSDHLVITSSLILFCFASLLSIQHHYGWGHHVVYVSEDNLKQFLKFSFIGQTFGIMGSTFGRLSFIVLVMQLFGLSRKLRLLLWVLFGLQALTNIFTAVLIYTQCTNVIALWDSSVTQDCWPQSVQINIAYAHTTFNGVTDLFLTIFPTVKIWNLQMALRLKVGLMLLLGTSLLAFVAVVMKIIYISALARDGDITFTTVPMYTWIVVEGALVALSASIPSIRPLVKQAFRKKGSSKLSAYVMDGYSYNTDKRKKFGNISNVKSSPVHANGNGSEEAIFSLNNPESRMGKQICVTHGFRVGVDEP